MNTANFVSIPAMMFPDQEILVFGERRWTYGELWQRIQQVGNALRSLGITPGDRVAVLQTNSDDYIATYFATALIGGVFVPLNYRAKPIELKHMLTTAKTKILLCGGRYVAEVDALRPELLSVQTYVALESEHAGDGALSQLGRGRGGGVRRGGDRRRRDDHPDVHQRHDLAAQGGDAVAQRLHRLRLQQRRAGRRHAARHRACCRRRSTTSPAPPTS